MDCMNFIHSMPQPLDSRQLRAFTILARTGSFTETARALHLSQFAVSHSMKALEGEAGCRLLDKMGKKNCVRGADCKAFQISGSTTRHRLPTSFRP